MTVLNRDDLRKIAVPSLVQALSFIFVAMLILIGTNADKLLQSFSKYIPTSGIRSGLAAVLHSISQLTGANTAVLILFWTLIGLTVYGISWLLFNVMVHAYNETLIETQFTNKGTWLEQLSPTFLQIFFGVAAIGFTLISAWVVPELVQNFSITLISWGIGKLPLQIAQTLLLALDLYVWWVLLRLTFYVE